MRLISFFLLGIAVACLESNLVANPAIMGEWDDTVLAWDHQTIHGILMKNGKVLCLDDPENPVDPPAVSIWDPVTNVVSIVVDPPTYPGEHEHEPVHIFCSGHTHLADGRIVFFGGGPIYADSHDHTVIFDPDAPLSNPWTIIDDMPPITSEENEGRRWYPTATRLADGKILVLSGGKNTVSTPAAD